MTAQEFLKEAYEKFPMRIRNKEMFLKANIVRVDYADGLIEFIYRHPELRVDEHSVESIYAEEFVGDIGGNSTGLLGEESYNFFWDNFVAKNTQFINWLKKHNLSHEDLMDLEICFESEDLAMTITKCSFWFYERPAG